MFKWLLISKYLRRKLAPLFAAVAVTICTAMVIIVMSVMGGFLDLLQSSAQKLTGDVTVRAGSFSGMPHYEDLIARIRRLPQVKQATPIVRGYGLIQIGRITKPVEVEGIRPHEMDAIVGFRDTLMWTTRDVFGEDGGVDLKDIAMDLRLPRESPEDAATRLMILGVEVNPRHYRDEQGQYDPGMSLVNWDVTLTVLPVSQSGAIIDAKVEPTRFVVINEFKSGLYEVDANRVFVAFDELQKLLAMNATESSVDMETGEISSEPTPARASEIVIKAAPGVDVYALRGLVEAEVGKFVEAHPDMLRPDVLTWEQRHATLLSAVKNEKGLVTFLFAIISVVAVVMVATTFYMIVLEKTRDVGVLRAIGASRGGIMNLFLGYGLVIGVLGAVLGMALAAAIVMNLNEIQAILKAAFGWQMWNPQVYFFERIPDRVDWTGAAWVMVGAVLSSVAGALIPAIIAARMNPVEALRYE